MTKDEMLDHLWSKDQIRDLVMRYCRACDRSNPALLESVFHPDALDDHGFNTTRTAREFIEAFPSMRSRMIELQHNTTNLQIEVEGDYGEGEAYIIAYHRFVGEDGPTLLLTGGRYLDKYERRNGEWRIAHRICTDDWTVQLPAPPHPGNEFTDKGLPRGCAGEQDASYGFFHLLKPNRHLAGGR